MLVAALMGAAEPAVVLRIGYGPNLSVVSAFLGFIVISLIGKLTRRRGTRHENNLVQTARHRGRVRRRLHGRRARRDRHAEPARAHEPAPHGPADLRVARSGGLLGVLLAVPLRKHYIDQENLTFADGTAAGETLLVLDEGPKQAGPRVAALGIGGAISVGLTLVRQALGWIPEAIAFRFLTPHAEALRVGTELGVLSLGAGMLVGFRVTLSMGLGMVLAWIIAPERLLARGLVPELTFNSGPAAVDQWPATGLMVAGGLTALALKWKVIAKTFHGLSGKEADTSGDFPMRWVIWGAIACAVVLAAVQKISLGFPLWLSAVSVLLSMVLMLVGIRVLGETNWAPISAMANVMQAVFAFLAPGHVAINMVGSGMSGAVAANGEHLMRDYRAGEDRRLDQPAPHFICSSSASPSARRRSPSPIRRYGAKYGIGGEGGLTLAHLGEVGGVRGAPVAGLRRAPDERAPRRSSWRSSRGWS